MSVTSEQIYHEGDHALYRVGGRDIEVEVIEERGPIGIGGRHLARIRMPVTAADPIEFEVAEAYLRPVTRTV
jgi:hypothetical protein